MKKLTAISMILALMLTLAPAVSAAEEEKVYELNLSSLESGGSYMHTATLDGQTVPEYDYTWHADPTTDHDQVKNSPAEYYTGTKPTGEDSVYIAHDIVYYPELEESKFQKVSYDGETEWVYMYEAPGYENYIFSTLPVLRTGFPSQMMHSEEEAYQNAVLHIAQPGTYRLTGDWHGQIWVDLGEEAFDDPDAKVTLILNGVDITCTVAPGVVFYNVYECDNAWEDRESYSHNVGTVNAGANVILADGTENNVSGTNVFRILKTKYKDDDSTDQYPAQKKAWKQDGAFYSYMSMNIDGEEAGTGVLNITSGNEGLNSELHLTLNGGHVNIFSQDDGINVNEDGVSTLTVNGGSLHICAGLGEEGDGIDSNGYLVVNGGTVITAANPASDSGLDSDCGSFVNGGTVVALGSAMDWAESDETSDSVQPVLNMQFSGSQNSDEAIIVTDESGTVVFAYDGDKDEVAGEYSRSYQGAIISAPTLEMGKTYRVYIGGDVEGTEESGVYDVSTVTGFEGATRQAYGGNTLMGGRPGGMGGQRPGDMGGQRPDGTRPQGEMPDGTVPEEQMSDGQMPDGTVPEGQQPMGTIPDGQFGGGMGGGFQGGGMGGQMPDGQATGGCTGTADFTLSQRINAFSGVSDYTHTLTQTQDGNYQCAVCGSTFADEQGEQLISGPTDDGQNDPSDPADDGQNDPYATEEEKGNDLTVWLIAALVFFGVALIGLTVTIIVLHHKKKPTA